MLWTAAKLADPRHGVLHFQKGLALRGLDEIGVLFAEGDVHDDGHWSCCDEVGTGQAVEWKTDGGIHGRRVFSSLDSDQTSKRTKI